MAKIIIKRKSQFVGSAQSHNVYLANEFIGELKNGASLVANACVGSHILSFKSTMKKMGTDTMFNVVVNNENEVVELKTEWNMNGGYEVKYADNAPHFPIYSESNADNPPASEPVRVDDKPHFRCSRCGSSDLTPISEVSTSGKNFKASDACCGWLLFGPIGVLCGATGKGKQTTTTTYWLCKGCGNKFKA